MQPICMQRSFIVYVTPSATKAETEENQKRVNNPAPHTPPHTPSPHLHCVKKLPAKVNV